jgi:hypothetical protein
MVKIRVFPYKQGSASAKVLAEAVEGKVLKLKGSKYRPREGDVVVNWGASNVPDFGPAKVLNRNVSTAQCKLKSFNAFKQGEVSAPKYWTDREDIPANAYPVVCRTVLRGHSGAGIRIAAVPGELVDAPLYTKYVKKQDEYRVHLLREDADTHKVIFVQRKARKLDVEQPDWQVRNLAGGFVFAAVEVPAVPEEVITQAAKAIEALGLDFGGVDVIWNAKEGKAYVLEANTACGLEERTGERYAEALRPQAA